MDGKWTPTKFKGKELKEKILGIIGYGSIGRRVAEIAKKGFDMKIIYINSKSSRIEFENLLRESDFISINTPLTEQTKGMISKKEFDLMKRGVCIINTGRGAVLDEKLLIDNLKSGKVFAAGLDVFSKEPIEKESLFINNPNISLTPHIGFNTEEAEYSLSQIVVDNIKNFVDGHPINLIS